MLPLLAGLAGLALMGNPFRKATKRRRRNPGRRNPPRDPRFAGTFKGDVPKGPVVGVHPLIDGDTAAVEGPRGWESWIFGPEIGPRGYHEVWQFAAKHPSERAAVEHAKEMVWGPVKKNPGVKLTKAQQRELSLRRPPLGYGRSTVVIDDLGKVWLTVERKPETELERELASRYGWIAESVCIDRRGHVHRFNMDPRPESVVAGHSYFKRR